MSSYRLVLQLTSALFAFAAVSVPVMGSPSRESANGEMASGVSNGFVGFIPLYETQEECATKFPPVDITFYYYNRQYPKGRIFDYASPPDTGILKSTPTKIVTHGYLGSLQSEYMQTLIKAYIDSEQEINLIALDWENYTKDMYRIAAKSAVKIGKVISSLFCILYKHYDIYPHQIHFIGHNLGAHLLAVTAREAKKKVGRITGLDPARLCFEEVCNGLHYPQLSKSDARFVDILHTDCLHTGVINAHGTADFYANNGKFQPECHRLKTVVPRSCDSLESIRYFAATVRQPFIIFANYCTSPYPNLICNPENGVYYSEHMKPTTRGIFNFNVNTTLLLRSH